MSALPPPSVLWADVKRCIGFYTLLPAGHADGYEQAQDEHHDEHHGGHRGTFAAAQWAAPLAGAVVGLISAMVFALALDFTHAPLVAAALAVSAAILATGALHEDGLADVADGFGGGGSAERKLQIMKDSRIGAYGVLALVAAFAIRFAALAQFADAWLAALALIAAHMASRAAMPAFMRALPPARASGLSAAAGEIAPNVARAALAFGALALLPLGLWSALLCALLLALWFFALKRLAEAQINGQTGDVVGALQQGGEAVVLVIAVHALV